MKNESELTPEMLEAAAMGEKQNLYENIVKLIDAYMICCDVSMNTRTVVYESCEALFDLFKQQLVTSDKGDMMLCDCLEVLDERYSKEKYDKYDIALTGDPKKRISLAASCKSFMDAFTFNALCYGQKLEEEGIREMQAKFESLNKVEKPQKPLITAEKFRKAASRIFPIETEDFNDDFKEFFEDVHDDDFMQEVASAAKDASEKYTVLEMLAILADLCMANQQNRTISNFVFNMVTCMEWEMLDLESSEVAFENRGVDILTLASDKFDKSKFSYSPPSATIYDPDYVKDLYAAKRQDLLPDDCFGCLSAFLFWACDALIDFLIQLGPGIALPEYETSEEALKELAEYVKKCRKAM